MSDETEVVTDDEIWDKHFSEDDTDEDVEDVVETDDEEDVDGEDTASDEEDTEDAGEDEPESEEDASDDIPAPKSLNAVEREFFKGLDADTKKGFADILARREADWDNQYQAKIGEVGEKVKHFDVLESVLSQHRGGNPADPVAEAKAIDELAKINQFAVSDPVGYMHWFADKFKLDLNNLPQAQQPDPSALLLQKIENLERKLTETSQPKTDYAAIVNKFAEENEFFDDVRPTVQKLLELGKATTLEDAYEQAIKLDANVQAVIRDREAKRTANLDQLAKAREAKEARKKGAPDAIKSKEGRAPSSIHDDDNAIAKKYGLK